MDLDALKSPASPRRQRELGHLLRFAVVGCLSVAMDLAVFRALRAHAGWDYPLAKGCSYLAGMVLGFGLNKWWAFGSRRAVGVEALSYGLLYGATLAVNVGIYAWSLAALLRWGLVEAAPAGAFVAATGTSTVLNYLGLRFITFRRGLAEREAALKGLA